MSMHSLFPTFVYTAALQRTGAAAFNRQLQKECLQLRLDDAAGRRWSAKNYPGGYTSYGSVHWLQRISPTFKALQSRLERHVKTFADAVDWDLDGRELKMTDCWLNIMPKLVVHGLHLHPLSTLSGTYYVRVPAGAPGIKFEDPRLDRFMAAPRANRPPGASRRCGERLRPRRARWCCLKVGCGTKWCRTASPPNASASASTTTGFSRATKPPRSARIPADDHPKSDATMAVFLDLENIALGAARRQVPEFRRREGARAIAAQGSYRRQESLLRLRSLQGLQARLHEAAFELIEIPHVRQSGKNSADIRMVVDALDLCYTRGTSTPSSS